MPPEERDPAYLLDMLEAAENVQRFLQSKTFQEYLSDDLLQSAVERNVEIIGEAARKISETFKRNHSEIPWRKIVAQRNVLIHQYETIDSHEIWGVATFHLPRLIVTLKPLIPPIPPDLES